MNLKKHINQFDTIRTSASVATPTCSSCCCCCCCLATTITSSSLLARRVNQETNVKKIASPATLRVLAALFLPVAGLLTYIAYYLINQGFSSCELRTYGSYSYRVCTNPANAALPFLLFGIPLLVLIYIYARIKMEHPVARAVFVLLCIALALAIEVWVGAMLILTGVGGFIYLALVPTFIGFINKWYTRHLQYKS